MAIPHTTNLSYRTRTALFVGKVVQALLRRLHFGGDALPGLVAERIDPAILQHLVAAIPDGTIAVCGTNGKTTTSRLISAALKQVFPDQVHNRSGSNLIRGHIAALLQSFSWSLKPQARIAILETDEAMLEQLMARIRPRAIVLHNLFRDQLDRYGEVDHIAQRWLAALRTYLHAETWLIINADDPQLAWLARELNHVNTFFYGIAAPALGTAVPGSVIDTVYSPVSGKPLIYARYYLSHLGEYTDPASDFTRPTLNLSLSAAQEKTETSQRISITYGSHQAQADVALPGLYNAYNVLAACAVAKVIAGLTPEQSLPAIAQEPRAFGRFELITMSGREARVILIKNPVGASEVFRTITAHTDPCDIAIIANDNYADGTDVSWYWDTQFELLADRPVQRLLTLGTRRHDMALRLHYAGMHTAPEVGADLANLFTWLKQGVAQTPVYILATYTGLLELQRELARKGIKQAYWQE